MGRCAGAHGHGCGDTGAVQGVWASQGSGTGDQEEGLQPSLPMPSAPRLLVYKHDIHKYLELVQPAEQGKTGVECLL